MANVKESPPPSSERDSTLFNVGRWLMSPILPILKGLSKEELASEPEFSKNLPVAGVAPVFIILGALAVLTYVFGATQQDTDPHVQISRFRLFMGEDWVLWAGLGLIWLGALGFVVAFVGLRTAIRVRSRAAAQADTQKAGDPAFRDVERIRAARAALEERLFQRNLKDEFYLKAFEWRGISFFDDGGYRFAPRVNVLLGKNGYGKTLLFRTLIAVLQRDGDYSGLLFANAAKSSASPTFGLPRLRVEVTRNGDTEEIIRDATYFDDSSKTPVGKVALLAIPDSRFLNRVRRTVAGAASTSEPLAKSGARNYLTQEPFENVVQDLLTQLCLDYLEPGGITRRGGFERQIFRLVEEVVGQLTEDQEFRFAEIKRVGHSGFEIFVHTAGSKDVAIPIQAASQGTLSVVAIFGLIYSFLHSLRPDLSEDKVSTGAGIVLIDEIDAHLHPSWQQKILGMLTSTFPNVQFIVSAHSPAIVAGCDEGEVSVLRRMPDGGAFYVDTLPEDFLGTDAQDLYNRVFEIEDIDRLYLEYAAQGRQEQEERERKIERLENKKRTQQEEEILNRLWRESRLFDRAGQAREQRLKSARDETEIAMQDAELERLRDSLREKEREIERLKESARRQAGEGGNAARVS